MVTPSDLSIQKAVDIAADDEKMMGVIRNLFPALVATFEVESSGDGGASLLYLFLGHVLGLDHDLALLRVFEQIHPRMAKHHRVRLGSFYWLTASNFPNGELIFGDEKRPLEVMSCDHRACSEPCFLPMMDKPPATGTLLFHGEVIASKVAAIIVVS